MRNYRFLLWFHQELNVKRIKCVPTNSVYILIVKISFKTIILELGMLVTNDKGAAMVRWGM